MSKLLKIFIIFIIIINLFFCIVNAETTNLYNDVQNESMYSLVVSGNGSINNYHDNTPPWYDYYIPSIW